MDPVHSLSYNDDVDDDDDDDDDDDVDDDDDDDDDGGDGIPEQTLGVQVSITHVLLTLHFCGRGPDAQPPQSISAPHVFVRTPHWPAVCPSQAQQSINQPQ
jgi:hypothetical protein